MNIQTFSLNRVSTRRALLFVALLLSACSTPYRPPQVVDAGAAFPGLADLAAQAGGKRADVAVAGRPVDSRAGIVAVFPARQSAAAVAKAAGGPPPPALAPTST